MGLTQSSLFPILNQGLFSANFLANKFPDSPIWRETPGVLDRLATAKAAIEVAHEAASRAGVFQARDEQKTEDKFIRPVLKALGWIYDPQPRHKRGKKKVRPDYALFASTAEYEAAGQNPNDPKAYYSRAQVIGEAKYWGRPLNDTVRDDPLDASDATAQLVRYLDEVYFHTDSKVLWGILTNGKTWRLFSHRAASRSTNFYEVDLEALLNTGSAEDFRRFYGFFAQEALTPDPRTGKRWVDLYMEESDQAARAVSDHLKNLIFAKVFPSVADGFLAYRRSEKGITVESDDTLKEVFAGTLTLLFRLLFLLYSESRDLLPLHDRLGYRKKSLQALKERVGDDIRVEAKHSAQSFEYWEHLVRLCRIVDKGDAALNVPHYNGGLFHATKKSGGDVGTENLGTRFLAEHKLADRYLAEAIRALTFDPDAEPGERRFIDYSALGVRHLGDVYEGLLEHRLRQGSGDTPVELESTSRERKETGSYFTPRIIVEFIVAKTVGPVLELRLKEVESRLAEWTKDRERRARVSSPDAVRAVQRHMEELSRMIFATLFSLRVLDPTMGSGHFLVHTVDYMADRIVSFLARHPGNPVISAIEGMREAILADLRAQRLDEEEIARIAAKLTEINLIKRMVMKRCVYGVDLNPIAVELAKLSLWLDSFTLGAPLSFLDHHLKCGNALVGARVDQVRSDLERDLFGTQFAGMLQATELMRQVGELTDATVAEVEESEAKFDHARQALAPFTHLLDIWQAEPFGHTGARKTLLHQEGEFQTLGRGKGRMETRRLLEGIDKTARGHRFFHWELEFPEVWYGGGRRLEAPGFDAVIGNPPWIRQETISALKKVLESTYRSVYHGVADIYIYVLARGLELLKAGGRLGFIIPNKWLRANYGQPLRTVLATQYHPELLVDFGHAPLFLEADTFPVVAVIRRPHEDDRIEETSLRVCPVPRETLDELKLAPFVEKHSFSVPILLLKREGWSLEPPDLLRLFEKIKNSGTSLKEFVGDIPYRGVVTGLNEAFFIDQSTRDRLIADDHNCEHLMKKLLRGRNINRWVAEWAGEWMIVLPSSHDHEWPWSGMVADPARAEKAFANEFPSLHAHFKRMDQALRKREDQGKFWWELRPCGYYARFEEPKIVYQEIQFHSWFALDEEGHYLNNKAFLIPSTDGFLLALLNSPLAWWFLWRYLPHMKDEAISPVTFLMQSFPVCQPQRTARATVEERVTRLITLAKSFTQKSAAFLQWVSHETNLPKLPASLESASRLEPGGFLAVLKQAGFKRATPAMLHHLTETFKREAAALRANRTEALRLERELDDLILKAYKLTPDETDLLRRTAPPRSPVAVLEESLRLTSD